MQSAGGSGGGEPVETMLDTRARDLQRATIAQSLPSYLSELRMYNEYCKTFNLKPFEITLEELCRYLSLFRNGYSAEKYLQAIRWAYRYVRQTNDSILYSGTVKQLIVGSRKATEVSGLRRKFSFLTVPEIEQMIGLARATNEFDIAALFALSFSFLARVRNELLNVVWGQNIQWQRDVGLNHNYILLKSNPSSIELHLATRKNAPKGAVLKRQCLCSSTKFNRLCPVHILVSYMQNNPQRSPQGRIFDVSYEKFTRRVRYYGERVHVEHPERLSSKAFRRGAAIHMVNSNHPLAEVLEAGGWRSSAFIKYILKDEVDQLLLFADLAEISDDENDTEVTRKRRHEQQVNEPGAKKTIVDFFKKN